RIGCITYAYEPIHNGWFSTCMQMFYLSCSNPVLLLPLLEEGLDGARPAAKLPHPVARFAGPRHQVNAYSCYLRNIKLKKNRTT
ncbi:MAG: hypothetical protein FWG56_09255, partial [Desulfovibrionaceae bacterium]|nr:hypothetical protein [Desulfovibrionaceae bacterium]